jgi:hypothetical protein
MDWRRWNVSRDELITTLKLMGYRRIAQYGEITGGMVHPATGQAYRMFNTTRGWFISQFPPIQVDDRLEAMETEHLESFYAYINQDCS